MMQGDRTPTTGDRFSVEVFCKAITLPQQAIALCLRCSARRSLFYNRRSL
ncbi:hypothetical protein [Calothrix sp. NIES-2100]